MTKKPETTTANVYPDQSILPAHYDLPEILSLADLPDDIRVRISRDKLELVHDADRRIWIARDTKVNLIGNDPWHTMIGTSGAGSNAHLVKSGGYVIIERPFINYRSIAPIAPRAEIGDYLPVKIIEKESAK